MKSTKLEATLDAVSTDIQTEKTKKHPISLPLSLQEEIKPALEAIIQGDARISTVVKAFLIGKDIEDMNYYLSKDATTLIPIDKP